MLFLFRSAPEVEKRIHSKIFCKFWEEPGYKRADLTYCTALQATKIKRPAKQSVKSNRLVTVSPTMAAVAWTPRGAPDNCLINYSELSFPAILFPAWPIGKNGSYHALSIHQHPRPQGRVAGEARRTENQQILKVSLVPRNSYVFHSLKSKRLIKTNSKALGPVHSG